MTIDELRQMAAGRFGDMVKGVVDLQRGILLLDADMHADQEAALLVEGARQEDLWGINPYPDLVGKAIRRRRPPSIATWPLGAGGS